jgi:hypothetical protein
MEISRYEMLKTLAPETVKAGLIHDFATMVTNPVA